MERRSQSLTSSGTAPGDLMLPATTEPWPEFPQAEPSVAGSNGTETPEAATPGGETPVAGAQGTEPTAVATPRGETPQDETPGTEPANGPADTVVFALPIRPQGPGPQVPAMPRPAKPPSWARVLATTLRLWAQRRFRRRSQPERAGRGPIVADAIVACDPAMCSVLQSKGIPASLLLVLASGKADPLGSDVVMATAAVRSQFGSRLAGVYAPVVLASFGQGSAQIVVRAVAPDGAPAYLAQLRSDWHARVVAGRQLLHNSRLHASAAARGQLAAGDVDSRLLTTLATMAALYPIDVAGFSGSGAHASAGIPLRSAEISGATGVAGTRSAASLSSLKAFLLAQRAPYLPAEMDIVRLATGQAVLRVIFTAPSPLGLLGSNS